MGRTDPSAPRTLGALLGLNGLSAGLSFLTTVALANALGPGVFGDYVFFVACGQYLLVFGQFGTQRTLVRDIVRSPDEAPGYSAAALTLGATSLALVAAITGGILYGTDALTLGGLLLVLGVGLRGLDLAGAFDAARRITFHTRLVVGVRLIYLGGIWILLLWFPTALGILAIGAVTVATSILLTGVQIGTAPYGLSWTPVADTVRAALRMARRNGWLLAAAVAGLTAGSFSKVVLRPLSGSEALGTFGAAWQIVVAASLVTTQVVRVGAPRLARLAAAADPVRLATFLGRYATANTGIAALVALPAVLFPEWITRLLFDPAFSDAAGPLRILGVMVVVTAAGQVGSQYLVMVHRDRATSMVSLLSAAIGPVLFFLLIPTWGGTGAAWAVLLTSLVTSVALIVLATLDLRGRLRTPPRGGEVARS